MRGTLVALVSGLLFGAGLIVSGMTLPSRVLGFLNLNGDWDPSLAFVMLGAIGVHFLAYRLVPSLKRPLLGDRWALPTRKDVDSRLLIGATLFGAGWGLAGYCPGPAITSAATGAAPTLLFVAAMLGGMWLHHAQEQRRAARQNP